MKGQLKKLLYIPVIFIGVEIGLRLFGYTPYERAAPAKAKFLKTDNEKGWVHIPGTYQFPINTWGDTMSITINERGERVTKLKSDKEGLEEVLLIGGSFTLGIGLNDEQTFAWKLQQKFPSVNIRNLGVGAYGTYQSLLVLEDQLKNGKRPKAVMYGLIGHHLLRNVSESNWVTTLTINAKQSDLKLVLPFVSLGENETLNRHRSAKIVLVPLFEESAFSFMTQKVINKISDSQKIREADQVLELLLLEMQLLCKRNDIPLYVNMLACHEPLMSKLTTFCTQNDIAYIDCNVPLNQGNTFQDDRHPKEEVNAEWAKRISTRLIQDGIVTTRVDSLK